MSAPVGTTSDADARLTALVQAIQKKVPADKKLTASVALKLIESKFAAQFDGVNLAEKLPLVESVLAAIYQPAVAAAPAPPPQSQTEQPRKVLDNTSGNNESKHDNDSDDSDSEDDDDSENSSEEEEIEEGEEGEEDSDEEFEGDEEDESSSDEEGEEGGQPSLKKPRIELDAAVGQESDEERVSKMTVVLHKLGYRASRKREDGESAADYLDKVLIPTFTAKKLDPTRCSKDDLRRYMARKELNDLQADGGSLTLDRTLRRGRSQLLSAPTSTQSQETTSRPMFLDDEEE
jgi:hypothetical protein